MLCAASGCTTLYAATPPRPLPARPAPIAAPPAAAVAAQRAAASAECVDAWPDALLPVTGAAGLPSGRPDALDGWPAASTRLLRAHLPWLESPQTWRLQRLRQLRTAGRPPVAKFQTLRPLRRQPSAIAAAAMRPAASAVAAAAAAAALRSRVPGGIAALLEAPCSAVEEQ